MRDEIVCLGCGKIVGGAPEWACDCPPPSITPHARGTKSAQAAIAKCPRCEAPLAEMRMHDATVLDCTGCGGLFLPKKIIDVLTAPDGGALRLAFPRRKRALEPVQVRYLSCPSCRGVMNRQNFASVSGVIVDVCKEHGIWFDAGEINAVIDFVAKGGMERAKQAETMRRAEEAAHLRSELRTTRAESQAALHAPMARMVERQLLRGLFSWFR